MNFSKWWNENKPMWPSRKNYQPEPPTMLAKLLSLDSFDLAPTPEPVQASLGPLFDNTLLTHVRPYAPVVEVFKLQFVLENLARRSSAYVAPATEVSRTQYFHDLHKAAATGTEALTYGAITAEVDGNKSVLTLDCDSTDEMLAVCNVLKCYYKLNYAVVVSSPNHYWVIVDKVATTTELLAMMEIIPGIDARYVDCIRNNHKLVLRGQPKEAMPVFPDSVEFTDERAARWYDEFKKAWQSEDMLHILRLKQLVKAIKEKNVAVMAASPGFVI